MDQLDLSTEELLLALNGLSQINKVSLTCQHLWKEIYSWLKKNGMNEFKILDIASGGGDVLVSLNEVARARNINLIGIGVDMNPKSCERAKKLSSLKNHKLDFQVKDIFSRDTIKNFDVIICSLFIHHLTNEQVTTLFKLVKDSTAKLFVVSDLKRSAFGYLLSLIGSKLLSGSKIVHYDGPISVKSAYSISEIREILNNAGMSDAKIKTCWPERFTIVWERI